MTGFTNNTSGRDIVDLRADAGRRHGLRVRSAVHRGVRHAAGAAAHRRHLDADAGAQHRKLDRHFGGDREPHQQDRRRSTAQLAEHITPFNDALRDPDVARWIDPATDQGRAIADQMLTLQAGDHGLRDRLRAAERDLCVAIPFVLGIGSTASLRGKKVAVEVVE